MTTFWFALARAVHLTSCLLLISFSAFERLVLPQEISDSTGPRRISVAGRSVLLSLVFISGAFWLALVASQMSGLRLIDTLGLDVLGVVWRQTQFGFLWRIRAGIWLASACVVCLATVIETRQRRARHRSTEALRSERSAFVGTTTLAILTWIEFICFTALGITLAGAGHGRTGGPPTVHLAADAVHLLACSVWPGGLLPLAVYLAQSRKTPDADRPAPVGAVISRFSRCSISAVLVLTATGIVNAWFLVGSVRNLYTTPYGQLLLAKLLAFVLMIGLGAINYLVLAPRISANADRSSLAFPRLRASVTTELALAVATQLIVGLMGMVPPAVEHLMHHH